MFSRVHVFIGWLGLIVEVAAIVGNVVGLLTDVFYLFIGVIVAFIMALWYLIAAWSTTAAHKSNVVASDGSPIVEWIYKYSLAMRVGSVLCMVLTIALAIGIFYFESNHVFDLAEATMPDFECSSMTQSPDNSGAIPLSYTVDEGEPHALGTLASQAETISVSLIKRHRIGWIEVTAVRVVVDQFVPATFQGQTSVVAHQGLPFLYLASIDKPTDDKKSSFPAHLLPTSLSARSDDQFIAKHSSVFLDDERPALFVVLLNARKPGLYSYHLEIDVTHRWERQTITVAGRKCAFDKAPAALNFFAPPQPGTSSPQVPNNPPETPARAS